MPWVKISDDAPHHPKARKVGLEAWALYIASLAYCAREETDGHIPCDGLADIWPWGGKLEALAGKLVAHGFWDTRGDGWAVRNYLDYQPSAASIRAARDKDTARKRGGFQPESERNPIGVRTDGNAIPAGIRTESDRNPDASRAGIPTRPDPTRPIHTQSEGVTSAESSPEWGLKPLVRVISERRVAAGGGPYRHTTGDYTKILEAVELFRDVDPANPEGAATYAFDAWASTSWARDAKWPVAAWLADPGKHLTLAPQAVAS